MTLTNKITKPINNQRPPHVETSITLEAATKGVLWKKGLLKVHFQVWDNF